jgi:hypothetical protein
MNFARNTLLRHAFPRVAQSCLFDMCGLAWNLAAWYLEDGYCDGVFVGWW